MTGIDHPTVTIGGRTLTVKFSLAAQLLMRRRGIDIRRIPSLIAPRLHDDGAACVSPDCEQAHAPNPDAENNIMRVFACMVAHEFVALDSPNVTTLDAAPSADYWAATAESEDFAPIESAVWSALGKALEARRARLQAVPPPEVSLAS
jgi:hypothetical protein